ncbi:hypothetical protein Tco_0922606 [Tanacetum coccineum]|uniref:Uncharacterized protein n=1 Tax=Tanacetum coccineum TaxID=301880 RepID=A0ABQ5D005_9ASTR
MRVLRCDRISLNSLVRVPVGVRARVHFSCQSIFISHGDLDEMSIDEAIERLKTFEERLKSKKEIQVDTQESLMFTRHEGQGKPFRERGRGRFNQSQGREQDKNTYQSKREERASFEEDTRDKSQVTCYRCHKLGPLAFDWSKQTQESSHENSPILLKKT